MKVAVYIRVSTTEQANEGYSIKAQKTRLNAFATSQDWDVVQYYVDEGISAKDMKRPELQRMLEGIKNRIFDCVLIYRLDRLTRSVVDLHELLKTFEKYDVKFKSATESYDTTTATGRLFITLVASMAQWERENLGERVSFGMEEKAREGKWTVSMAPYGYDLKENKLTINEAEASVVKEIFELYSTGQFGQLVVARKLNDRGLRSRAGVPFNGNSVRYMLANPIYIGTMRYNFRVRKENYFEVENSAPPIVESDVFHRVQEIIQRRTSQHPRRAASPYIFSGVVKCKRCGKPLNGKVVVTKDKRGSNKKYDSFQYYCPTARIGLCDQKIIAQSFLDSQFLSIIGEWNIETDIKAVKTKAKSKRTQEITVPKLMRELADVQKRIDKWQFAWVEEIITDEDFQTRMEEERAKERALNIKIDNQRQKGEHLSTIDLPLLLHEIKDNWSELSVQEKKQLVSMTVKELSADKISPKRVPASVEVSNLIFK